MQARKFRKFDLSEMTFDSIDFRGSDFRQANLTFTTFRNCNLTDCNFHHAQLQQAWFEDCVLNGARFNSVFAGRNNTGKGQGWKPAKVDRRYSNDDIARYGSEIAVILVKRDEPVEGVHNCRYEVRDYGKKFLNNSRNYKVIDTLYVEDALAVNSNGFSNLQLAALAWYDANIADSHGVHMPDNLFNRQNFANSDVIQLEGWVYRPLSYHVREYVTTVKFNEAGHELNFARYIMRHKPDIKFTYTQHCNTDPYGRVTFSMSLYMIGEDAYENDSDFRESLKKTFQQLHRDYTNKIYN